MKSLTLGEIRGLGPCWLETQGGREKFRRIGSRKERWTAFDVLKLPKEEVSSEDKLWLVLREEFLSARVLHLFACEVAEKALERVEKPDPRSVEAIRVKRLWVDGKATNQELAAARSAAWAAERDATWAVASAAARATASAVASAAARAAASAEAWAVARAAARATASAVASAAARTAESAVARAAARAAARDSQVEALMSLLESEKNEIEKNEIEKNESEKMEFTITEGYYDYSCEKVIPCKFLAVKHRYIQKGITPGEFGAIKDGVFFHGIDGVEKDEIWYIDTMNDLLCMLRDPHEGEVHLKVNPSFGRESPYNDYADSCGEMDIHSDGKVVIVESRIPGIKFKEVFPLVK